MKIPNPVPPSLVALVAVVYTCLIVLVVTGTITAVALMARVVLG